MDRIKNRNSNLLCRTVFLKRTGKETLEKQVRPRKCKPFNVLLLDPLLLLSDHTDYFLSKPPCVRTSKLLDCENLLHSVWKLQKKCLIWMLYTRLMVWSSNTVLFWSKIQEIYDSSSLPSLRFITSIERNNLMVVVPYCVPSSFLFCQEQKYRIPSWLGLMLVNELINYL